MTKSLKEKLESELHEANWDLLKPHALKDSLILVDPSLNIVDVGLAIAEDDEFKVTAWLEKGLLTKPTLNQFELWEKQADKSFQFLIVQPYVLTQPQES